MLHEFHFYVNVCSYGVVRLRQVGAANLFFLFLRLKKCGMDVGAEWFSKDPLGLSVFCCRHVAC